MVTSAYIYVMKTAGNVHATCTFQYKSDKHERCTEFRKIAVSQQLSLLGKTSVLLYMVNKFQTEIADWPILGIFSPCPTNQTLGSGFRFGHDGFKTE